jgi:hyperosmotically inducible periplasmic protein
MVSLLKSVIILIVVMVIMNYTNAQAEEASEIYDDSVITQRVKEAFAADPVVNKLDITVETREGVVQLSGFADIPEQINRAGEIAAGIEGVKSVMNILIPSQESFGEFIDDSVIIGKIMTAFVVDPTVSALNIKVNSLNGIVQLSGFTDSAEEARKAEEIAAGTKGVKVVRNNIIVKPEEDESVGEYIDDSVITVKIKSTFALDPATRILDIRVMTFKGMVQLSGFVDTPAESQKAEEIASGVKGVKSVRNDIIVK